MGLRYDVVGDIAIINRPSENGEIADARKIIEINKKIKVVLCKSGSVNGEFRLPNFRKVLGEDRTTTIHHENGCSIYVDLASVHFSPRLIRERTLIANAESIRLCLRNIILNHQRGKIIAVLADAKEVTQNLFHQKMDRILLPLPIKSKQYLNLALSKLKQGGIIHYYDFIYSSKNESPIKKAFTEIIGIIKNNTIIKTDGRIVKSVAPRCYLVSIKLLKR
jgi:tRNA (guanine37-N1)-methyltransferase